MSLKLHAIAGVQNGGTQSASASRGEAVSEAGVIGDLIDVVAKLNPMSWGDDPNFPKGRLPELYKALSATQNKMVEADLPFYRGECLILMEEPNKASAIARDQLAEGHNTPDFLLLNMRSDSTVKGRGDAKLELGRILPISVSGMDRDNRLGGPTKGMVDPGPPSVPRGSIIVDDADKSRLPAIKPGTYNLQDALSAIADIYMSAGFAEDALNTYLEAFYAMPFSDQPSLRGRIWLHVADLEKTRGNKELAIRAYLKAAYNWPKYAEQAKKGVAEVLSQNEPQESQKPKPILRKDAAVAIATLYQKLNLHPLALVVLERSEQDTGQSLSDEKTEILKKWQTLLVGLERSKHDRGQDSYIFGYRASEVKDWAKIKILRPTDTFWKLILDTRDRPHLMGR
jgi:tetratricopeptide (TPR) repeat protein